MRRVDGVLPSGVLSAKYHVAWTRSGRLVFSKNRYLYHTLSVPWYLAALVLALPLLAAPKRRVRVAGRFLHCFEAVRVRCATREAVK